MTSIEYESERARIAEMHRVAAERRNGARRHRDGLGKRLGRLVGGVRTALGRAPSGLEVGAEVLRHPPMR